MEKTKENLNKAIYIVKTNKWIHYIFFIIIGIILSLRLNEIQIIGTHDGYIHYLRLVGTVDTLSIGQFPPLINQNFCKGFGYAMNLFYQPIVTYIPLLIYFLTKSYMTSLKLFGALCIILSGITMYHFTYQVTKNRVISVLAGFFYMIAPYKLSNIYIRYAVGEFTALVFLPFVFLGLHNLFEQDGKKHYYISIGAIGLMLSHTVTTLYTVMFCFIYTLFYISKFKNKQIIEKCVINIIFVLLISLFFIGPLFEACISAKYSIMDNNLMRTYGRFAAKNTISLTDLLVDLDEEKGVIFLLGIPTIFAIILTPFLFKKIDKKYIKFYLVFFILFLFTLLLISKYFPWTVMPNILCKLQFPWRIMGFSTFFISFICGINLYNLIKCVSKKEFIKIIIILLFILVSIIDTVYIINNNIDEEINTDEKYEMKIQSKKIGLSHKAINRDYMPVKAIYLEDTYVEEREDKVYVLSGDITIIEENKENLTDNIKFKNVAKETIIEFPYFYYPGYEIELKVNEEIKTIKAFESENGFIACEFNEDIDEGNIKIEYKGTKITYISYIISALSMIIFIVYIVRENKKGELDEQNKEIIK